MNRGGRTNVRHNGSYFHKQRSFVSPQKRTKSVSFIMKHSTVTAGGMISYLCSKTLQGFKEFPTVSFQIYPSLYPLGVVEWP